MRESEKPFILFRRNRFIYNISPRNASGWMQMGVWMALFVPLVAGFAAYDSTRAADSAWPMASAESTWPTGWEMAFMSAPLYCAAHCRRVVSEIFWARISAAVKGKACHWRAA